MQKNQMKHSTALIIFAREPKLGQVKTRLQVDISATNVLKLYKAFIKDVLGMARNVKCDLKYLYYSGHGASIPFIRANAKGFNLKRQYGQDLGERMYRAVQYCHQNHFSRIIIIGTDCLDLKATEINRAFNLLLKKDCVVGPTKDGGYYLLGLSKISKKIFNNINWSTDHVLIQTFRRINQCGFKSQILKIKEDIDTMSGLHRLIMSKTRLNLSKNTQRVLKSINLHKQ